MRRVRWILIIAAGLGIAALIGITLAQRSSARKALFKYKAELRAKGEKLTLEELRTSLSTNAHEIRIVLTNAGRKLADMPLSPGSWDSMRFVAPGRVQIAWAADRPPGDYWNSPPAWYSTGREPGSEWSVISSYFANAEEALSAIRHIMESPSANEGFDWNTNIFSRPPTPFVNVRLAAQWLAGATLNDLHQNRIAEASANLRALAGIANLNRDEPNLIHQMIRVAITGTGLSATWQALQASAWNESQLATLQNRWEKVDLIAAAERGWLGERAIGEPLWEQARSGRWSRLEAQFTWPSPSSNVTFRAIAVDNVVFPLYRATSMDEDELLRLRIMQGGMETIRAVRAGQPWQTARRSLDKSVAELNSISGPIDRFRYWLTSISTPSFQKGFQTCVRREMERRMTITAIAVKRYELAHGKPLPTLDALVPQFLSAVPIDLMSGQPLRYRLNPDGTFVLYSVGEDGADDGGDPNPPTHGGKVGLWEGKDAVWPSPARPEDEQPKPAEK